MPAEGQLLGLNFKRQMCGTSCVNGKVVKASELRDKRSVNEEPVISGQECQKWANFVRNKLNWLKKES